MNAWMFGSLYAVGMFGLIPFAGLIVDLLFRRLP
jgi:hypothetical protein